MSFLRRSLAIRFHYALLLQSFIEFLNQAKEFIAVSFLRDFGSDFAPRAGRSLWVRHSGILGLRKVAISLR